MFRMPNIVDIEKALEKGGATGFLLLTGWFLNSGNQNMAYISFIIAGAIYILHEIRKPLPEKKEDIEEGKLYIKSKVNGKIVETVIDDECAEEEEIHASDCAVHNSPAYKPGPCDCSAELEEVDDEIVDIVSQEKEDGDDFEDWDDKESEGFEKEEEDE